jgi:hypothetical protein
VPPELRVGRLGAGLSKARIASPPVAVAIMVGLKRRPWPAEERSASCIRPAAQAIRNPSRRMQVFGVEGFQKGVWP